MPQSTWPLRTNWAHQKQDELPRDCFKASSILRHFRVKWWGLTVGALAMALKEAMPVSVAVDREASNTDFLMNWEGLMPWKSKSLTTLKFWYLAFKPLIAVAISCSTDTSFFSCFVSPSLWCRKIESAPSVGHGSGYHAATLSMSKGVHFHWASSAAVITSL